MAQTFNNECPYCGSRDIENCGHVDDFEVATDAEEYQCKGKCRKTFYMQNHDERMVMMPTMKDDYLNSYFLTQKERLIEAIKMHGIDANTKACGNCVSYIWGQDSVQSFTCKQGLCSFQNNHINFAISDGLKQGALDAKTDACECDYFYNFRTNLTA